MFPVYPSICHELMGTDAVIFIFWMFSSKPTFSLSSFILSKRLFSSSLSALRMMSSVYLRLLILLLAILIPACPSASPHFSRYTLHIITITRVTIFSRDVPLFLLETSLLFHAQFKLLLPDLHTGFSRDRSGGLVFPSLSEFFTA